MTGRGARRDRFASLRTGPFEDAYRALAAAPYAFGLWDEPDEPTGLPEPDGESASLHDLARRRRLEELGLIVTLGGLGRFPLLHSWADTPFELDGIECASVEAFYQSLRIPDEELRRAYARKPFPIRRRPAKRFRYADEWIDVWSIDHDVLIARAVEAKVQRHSAVRHQLDSTERRPIYVSDGLMSRRFDGPSGGTWRAVPLALMLMRVRR